MRDRIGALVLEQAEIAAAALGAQIAEEAREGFHFVASRILASAFDRAPQETAELLADRIEQALATHGRGEGRASASPTPNESAPQ